MSCMARLVRINVPSGDGSRVFSSWLVAVGSGGVSCIWWEMDEDVPWFSMSAAKTSIAFTAARRWSEGLLRSTERFGKEDIVLLIASSCSWIFGGNVLESGDFSYEGFQKVGEEIWWNIAYTLVHAANYCTQSIAQCNVRLEVGRVSDIAQLIFLASREYPVLKIAHTLSYPQTNTRNAAKVPLESPTWA